MRQNRFDSRYNCKAIFNAGLIPSIKENSRNREIPKRGRKRLFNHGVVARVSDRLDAMQCARDAAVRAQRSTGTDLIVAKNRVVEEAFGEIDIRLVRMAATGRRVITTAFRAGWAAGDRVNLNRPVMGDAPRQLA